MAKLTLQKYIKKYLTEGIGKKERGYAAWLEKNGISSEKVFEDSIAKALSEYEKGKSKNGRLTEDLISDGLFGSGYAAYLKDMNTRKRNDSLIKSAHSYMGGDAASRAKFSEENEAKEKARLQAEEAERKKEAERLEKEKKAKDAAYKTAKRGLETSATINYEDAYEYAIQMGVDEESAKTLAETTTRVARAAAIDRVVRAIFNRTLTRNQAMEYASGLGLSREDVKELGKIAERANQSIKDIATSDDYLEYLKNKNNSK